MSQLKDNAFTLGSDCSDWLSESLLKFAAAARIDSSGGDTTPSDPKHFTIVTWNIWFSEYEWQARLEQAIWQTLQKEPDVFCYQEVTTEIHSCMLRCKYLRDRYAPTETSLPFAYDCAIWVRADTSLRKYDWSRSTVGQNAMQGRCGRRGLCLDISLTSGQDREGEMCRIRVLTAHLESGKGNASIRRVQLEALFSHIRGIPWTGKGVKDGQAIFDAAFFAGDFNLDPSYAENQLVDANGVDLWKQLRSGDVGYTEDTYKNQMRYLAHGKHKQVRFDRIVQVHPFGNRSKLVVQPLSIDLLGTEPFEKVDEISNGKIWPSDHFGLVARVALCESDEQAAHSAPLKGAQPTFESDHGYMSP